MQFFRDVSLSTIVAGLVAVGNVVSDRQAFLDIERVRPCSPQIDFHPGHR